MVTVATKLKDSCSLEEKLWPLDSILKSRDITLSMTVCAALNRPANLENSAVATGLEKVSVHSNSKERQCQRISTYHTIALISHASKVMLKILQARLQQYVNCELPDVQAGFRRGRRIRDQMANIHWVFEKAREFQKKKTSISALLTMPKPLTVWITINCGKFWKRWEYQTTWSASWETCMQVRK